MLSFCAGAGAADVVAGASVDGFNGGRAAAGLASACRVSAGFASTGLKAFGSGFASALLSPLDLAAGAGGGVEDVVSAVAPPMPTLRARLEKKPSDCWLSAGAAEATRVFCAAGAGLAAATTGSS